MSDPTTSIVYTEIARLNFTTEERTALRSFFSNPDNKETKNEAEEVLPTCATDVEKVDYLKTFLTQPGNDFVTRALGT